jgi:hypothetical protein
MQKSTESGMQARMKKIMVSKVLNLRLTRSFKGTSAAPHHRCRARRVSGTFAHTRARPSETGTHSRDASIPRHTGLQCLCAVMMERSRLSRQPNSRARYYVHIYYDGHDYPDEASPSYNGYNHT